MPKVGQITFNLTPYKNSQKSQLNTYAYKILKTGLKKGIYNIKINNQYLNKGFNLKNATKNIKTIWGADEESSYDTNTQSYLKQKAKYLFYLKDNKIVLEVR